MNMAPAHDASINKASPVIVKNICTAVSQLCKFTGNRVFPVSCPAAAIMNNRIKGEMKAPSDLCFSFKLQDKINSTYRPCAKGKKITRTEIDKPAEFMTTNNKLIVKKPKAAARIQVEILASLIFLIRSESK